MVSIAETNAPEGLDTIRRDDVEVAIWRRILAAPLCDWIDGLPADKLPTTRAIVAVSEIGSAVDTTCDRCGTPNGLHRRLWIDDIAGVTARFAKIMQLRDVEFRLDVIDNDACARFHADNVRARLICTYRGPGTEYGPARPGQIPDPIRSVPRFSPAVFRGIRWYEHGLPAIVHRSPPISGTGQTRLVLIVNPPESDGMTDF